MALVRWSPFQELADMRREMQSLMSQLWTWPWRQGDGQDHFIPAVDVTTSGDDLKIRVELPGIDPDKDVNVSVQENVLRVSGQRRAERKEEKEGYFFREMRYGSFERDFTLPEGVGEDAVSAEYRDGVLDITVKGAAKKIEGPQPKRIEIKRTDTAKQLDKAA